MSGFLARVVRLDAPVQPAGAERAIGSELKVMFDNNREALLPAQQPNAALNQGILDELQKADQLAYVLLDPDERTISKVFVPHVTRVESITPMTDGDFDVTFERSVGVHTLPGNDPGTATMIAALEQSRDRGTPVAITEWPNEHRIFAVTADPAMPLPCNPPVTSVVLHPPSVTSTLTAITSARARELFNLLRGRTCDPTSPSGTCIPFNFPDDGCWARAHEMCRFMANRGVDSAKVWSYGHLRVDTRNHPSCRVPWNCHVAPVVRVRSAASNGHQARTSLRVIDPSLFSGPVSVPRWLGIQGDPAATHVVTDADVFDRSVEGRIRNDDHFACTPQILNFYRTKLRERSADASPPPYMCGV